MERIIDFQVSVSGQDTVIIRVSYDQDESSFVKDSPAQIMRDTIKQAFDALEKEVGHSDFEVYYWWWIK